MLPMIALAALAAQATPVPPAPPTAAQGNPWPVREADVVLRDFHFRDGEVLPELRIHYTTLGQPHRNAAGAIEGLLGDQMRVAAAAHIDETVGLQRSDDGVARAVERFCRVHQNGVEHANDRVPVSTAQRVHRVSP